MPLIEFGRIPGIRRLVRSQRAIQAGLGENTWQLAIIGDDIVSLLKAARALETRTLALETRTLALADMIETVEGLLRAAPTQADAAAIQSRLDALETQSRHDHRAVIDALEMHDKQSLGRLDALRESLAASSGLTSPVTDPAIEVELCADLLPLLDERSAIDVGAHRGEFARSLADGGASVLAVEPNEELALHLEDRFKDSSVVVRQVAAWETNGRAQLYLAKDKTPDGAFGDLTLFSSLQARQGVWGLEQAPGAMVQTATVDQLRQDAGWPEQIGLVKIDVEGSELEVLRGLGSTRPEALLVEYWGEEYIFATDSSRAGIKPLLDAIEPHGLGCWLALIHRGDSVWFDVNPRSVPADTWGNVLFVQDRETFAAVTAWCAGHLARYPAPGPTT